MRKHLGWLGFVVVAALATGVLIKLAGEMRVGLERGLASGFWSSLTSVELRGEEWRRRHKPVILTLVGDVMLDRGVARVIRENDNYIFPWLMIKDELRAADVAFGNLEGPVSDRGRDQGGPYSFRFDPRVTEGLREAGFDVMSLANNHILDWGGEALIDTRYYLETNGIGAVGAGRDELEARRPVVTEVRGNRIAWLAYTNLYPERLVVFEERGGVAGFDLEKVREEIEAVRRQGLAETVVVSLHWGEEYETEPAVWQREAARRLVEAGADLVVGHHPHVVQSVEKYGEGWIAYSLGNFVFDQNFSEATMQGLMLQVEVQEGRVKAVREMPIRINNSFQPEIVEVD